MQQQNYKAVEFFLSNYRLSDMELRTRMVTSNFKFITPALGDMSFAAYHNYVAVMRNHTGVQVNKILVIDDYNYNVEMEYTSVDNASNYVQEFKATLKVKFNENLIDSLTLSYDIPIEYQDKFKQLMAPIYKDLQAN